MATNLKIISGAKAGEHIMNSPTVTRSYGKSSGRAMERLGWVGGKEGCSPWCPAPPGGWQENEGIDLNSDSGLEEQVFKKSI